MVLKKDSAASKGASKAKDASTEPQEGTQAPTPTVYAQTGDEVVDLDEQPEGEDGDDEHQVDHTEGSDGTAKETGKEIGAEEVLGQLRSELRNVRKQVKRLRRQVRDLGDAQAGGFDEVRTALGPPQEPGGLGSRVVALQDSVDRLGPTLANNLGFVRPILDEVDVRAQVWTRDAADAVVERLRPGPVVIPNPPPERPADPAPLEAARCEVEVLLRWAAGRGYQAEASRVQDYLDELTVLSPAQFDVRTHSARLDDLRDELQRAQRRERAGR